MIIGGDLNFSLGQAKVWGPHARPDILSDYFTRHLVDKNWLDVEPMVLMPTWKNNRCGEGRVEKRLDSFLISKRIVDNRQSFDNGLVLGDSRTISQFFWRSKMGRSNHLVLLNSTKFGSKMTVLLI